MLDIWTDMGNKIVEFGDSIKDFFIEHGRNPILWIGIILLGLAVFEFTYRALHKD